MTFPKWRIIRCALALWLAGCAAFLPVRGQQDATELAALYNSAMVAFQQGKWGETVQGLEKFISMIVDPKQQATLHPIYFTLGAAYFNMENYGKAIETFDTYLKRFPNAERVIDVKLGLAQACLLSNQYERAIKLYEQLETIPEHREQALTAQVRAYKETRKFDDAIRVLEKLVGPDIVTSAQANAAIELAQLHADRNQPEKAVVLLDKLQTKTAIIENLVALNNVGIKLGDEFAEKERFREAIQAYRAVRMRHEVLKFQTERIASMERRMAENLRAATGNPQLFVQMTQTNNAIKAAHAEAKTLLGEFEKLPDFAPALLLRMGKCWHDWDRKWEAIVVYERVLQKYPEAKEREAALYAKIISYTDLALPARTQAFCEQYIKEFPSGPNAGIVGYLSGAVALQANDPKSAESYFGTMLEKQPDSSYREEMRMLLGNARFMQGKHDEATKDYRKYIADYPKGQFIEEVIYRLAVTQLFGGEYQAALAAVKEYLSTYPSGSYVADARYRHAVCQYALQRYDPVVQECKSWIAGFQNNEQEGEVQALLGDALAAQNKPEEAIPAYVRSSKSANNSDVVNYSLFEASKHLQKLGKWAEVAALFEEFVRDQPNSEAVVAAMYWIGRAKAQQGKVDEAKAFLVETLRKYIEEPKREAVEQLISQLAQLCSKRPRAVAIQTVAATPAPSGGVEAKSAPEADRSTDSSPPQSSSPESATPVAVSAPAEPPPYDPFAELDKQLAPLSGIENNTAKARLLYARAELAALRKRAAEQEKIYREIADRFNPMDLSPVLLSVIGDFLLQSGDIPRAATLFQRLKEDFPRSDYLDTAYVGLGEIALREKDYPKALELFTDALDKVAASMKTKEATIGKAKTLFALGKYEEARKYFEQIASVREWRGESTAFALYSLGEIEAHQNRLPEAIAHFRRVFVAYQKFLPWVAKAYLRAADSFEKMGKRADAIENLREMLRNERLEKFPEVQEARKRLEQWGAAA